jgi:hypothetical protein
MNTLGVLISLSLLLLAGFGAAGLLLAERLARRAGDDDVPPDH